MQMSLSNELLTWLVKKSLIVAILTSKDMILTTYLYMSVVHVAQYDVSSLQAVEEVFQPLSNKSANALVDHIDLITASSVDPLLLKLVACVKIVLVMMPRYAFTINYDFVIGLTSTVSHSAPTCFLVVAFHTKLWWVHIVKRSAAL